MDFAWTEEQTALRAQAKDVSPETLHEIFDQLAESLGSEVRPQERGFLDWLKEAISG